MKEIIAARIKGTIITNNLPNIIEASKNGMLNQVYNREMIKFMSDCDLGKNWDDLAKGPTLFFITDDGKYKWPD